MQEKPERELPKPEGEPPAYQQEWACTTRTSTAASAISSPEDAVGAGAGLTEP